jgi:ADP-ribose pyrophosphatase
MKKIKKKTDRVFEKVIRRQRVFEGVYLKLDSLRVRLPDGQSAIREVVLIRNAVAVLPLGQNNCVHLVRQHRPAIGTTLIEIPAGLINAGETPEAAARRECEEETGYRPERLKKLITYAHAEGYSTGFVTLFVGTGLVHTGNLHLDSTEFVEQVSMPFEDLRDMVKRNEILDSKTILCTVLWADHLKSTEHG